MRHGFLLVDKPLGPTSHDIVAIARKFLSERSIGHIGTLDPAASGLMVLGVGSKALKVIELFSGLSKEYVAEITLGKVSTTYDCDGVLETVELKPGWQMPDEIGVRRMLEERFVGTVSQKPPAHSAVHIDGQRAYDLARQGKIVEMQPRQVTIDECTIMSYNYPNLTLKVRCGSGTYIRSLAHDLGEALRCGAYLSGLRRTKVGDWKVEDAVQTDAINWTDVVPLKIILEKFTKLELTDAEWEDIKHGRTIKQAIDKEAFAWHQELPVALLTPCPGGCRPRKVL